MASIGILIIIVISNTCSYDYAVCPYKSSCQDFFFQINVWVHSRAKKLYRGIVDDLKVMTHQLVEIASLLPLFRSS